MAPAVTSLLYTSESLLCACLPLSTTAVNKMIGPWLLTLNVHGTSGLRMQIEKQLVVVASDCIFLRPESVERLALKPKGAFVCAWLMGRCLLLIALVIRGVRPSSSLPSPWPS